MEPNTVENAIEYLKSLVKWTAFAIGFIISVALLFTYADLNSLREEHRLKADEIKKDAALMVEELKYLRSEARADIQNAQNYTLSQIELIRDDAGSRAYVAANNRIDEIMSNERGVKSMIENSAAELIEKELKSYTSSTVEKFKQQNKLELDTVAIITSSYQKTEYGEKKELVKIIEILKSSNSELVKSQAQFYFNQVKSNYDLYHYPEINEQIDKILLLGKENKDEILYKLLRTHFRSLTPPDDSLSKDEKQAQLKEKLFDILNQSNDLNEIAYVTLFLNRLFNEKIELFDFSRIHAPTK